jgi:hypothetical protein
MVGKSNAATLHVLVLPLAILEGVYPIRTRRE